MPDGPGFGLIGHALSYIEASASCLWQGCKHSVARRTFSAYPTPPPAPAWSNRKSSTSASWPRLAPAMRIQAQITPIAIRYRHRTLPLPIHVPRPNRLSNRCVPIHMAILHMHMRDPVHRQQPIPMRMRIFLRHQLDDRDHLPFRRITRPIADAIAVRSGAIERRTP